MIRRQLDESTKSQSRYPSLEAGDRFCRPARRLPVQDTHSPTERVKTVSCWFGPLAERPSRFGTISQAHGRIQAHLDAERASPGHFLVGALIVTHAIAALDLLSRYVSLGTTVGPIVRLGGIASLMLTAVAVVAWAVGRAQRLGKPWHVAAYVLPLSVLAISAGFWPNENLDGGRDEGANNLFSYELTKTETFAFPAPVGMKDHVFFQEISPGQSTHVKVPGYHSVASVAYRVAGFDGVYRINLVFMVLAIIAAEVILSTFYGLRAGIAFVALASLSYSHLWFAKSQDDNVYALFLLVSFGFLFWRLRSRPYVRLAAAIPPLFLLALSRPEGIAFSGAGGLLLLFQAFRRHKVGRKRLIWATIAAGLLIPALLLVYLFSFQPSWGESKSFSKFGKEVGKILGTSDSSAPGEASPGPTWDDFQHEYEWDIFTIYGVAPAVVLAGIAILAMIRRRDLALLWRGALLFSPVVIFLFIPGVSIYHPWYMRHYVSYFVLPTYWLAAVAIGGWKMPLPSGRIRAFAIVLLTTTQAVSSSFIVHQHEDYDLDRFASALRERQPTALLTTFHSADIGGKKIDIGTAMHFLLDIPVVSFGQSGNPYAAYSDWARSLFDNPDVAERVLVMTPNLPTGRPNGRFQHYFSSQLEPTGFLELETVSIQEQFLNPYVFEPPLEQGYAPLERSLLSLPHTEFVEKTTRVNLYYLRAGQNVLENVSFSPEGWQFSHQGIFTDASSFRFAYSDFSFGLFPIQQNRPLAAPVQICVKTPLSHSESQGLQLLTADSSKGSASFDAREVTALPNSDQRICYEIPPGTVLPSDFRFGRNLQINEVSIRWLGELFPR